LFTDTDTPATIGLLIDSSGSMYQHRAITIDGATAFATVSHPHDEIFALAFNEYVTPVLPAGAPFTTDAPTLRGGLERNVSSRGRTALYDAISDGVEYLFRGTRERKVLVLLSDGGDNASHTPKGEAVHKAQASNAVIYTIGLIEPGSRDANPQLLKELSLASGGESFRPRDSREIAEALDRIARDIRHTYTIGYTSTNPARDGAFRSVRVIVTAPPGQSLVVRSRTGYRAGMSAR
jgi:Ca-activated chloride channel homolog